MAVTTPMAKAGGEGPGGGQAVRVEEGGDHDAGGGHQHRDGEHLGRDEELEEDEHAECDPAPRRRALPPDEDLVEDDEDERRYDEQADRKVALRHVLDHHGRVAEEETGDPTGRLPGDDPPAGQPTAPGAQAGRQGEGDRRCHQWAEEPGDRAEHQARQRRAGVVQQVDAVGWPQPGGEEWVEAVGQRVGRPGDEPHLLARVEARATDGRCRATRPCPPPKGDRRNREDGDDAEVDRRPPHPPRQCLAPGRSTGERPRPRRTSRPRPGQPPSGRPLARLCRRCRLRTMPGGHTSRSATCRAPTRLEVIRQSEPTCPPLVVAPLTPIGRRGPGPEDGDGKSLTGKSGERKGPGAARPEARRASWCPEFGPGTAQWRVPARPSRTRKDHGTGNSGNRRAYGCPDE